MLQFLRQLILRACIGSWNILRRSLVAFRRLVDAVSQCPTCVVTNKWNEELKAENHYLKSLLLEPPAVQENKVEQPFKSFKRPSWKEVQAGLAKRAHKVHKEFEAPTEVE